MRRTTWLLLCVLVAGCSGARPDADLPPQYAVVPSSDVAVSDPMFGLSDDPGLNSLLAGVASAMEGHDWRALAYTLHPAEYAQQFAFFRSDMPERAPEAQAAQILRETFGLGFRDNNLAFPDGRDAPPFARLDRIRSVHLDRYDPESGQVEGRVVLEDGSARRLGFSVARFEDRWVVTVPAG